MTNWIAATVREHRQKFEPSSSNIRRVPFFKGI